VFVIPHGDEAALRGGGPLPAVAETAPVALFFGLWTAYKGIDVLLDAWPSVRAAVPAATLVIAGAPGVMDPDEVLRPARAAGGVDVRAGYVDRDDIPGLFGATRVVVTPYVRASQSGVAHLAFTFDRPVVATTVGDIPKVVQEGVSGLLVPPRDAAALAEALIALLSDADRAARLGAAGGEWLRREASWETVAERVMEGLTSAATSGSPR
jgi:glycosyltransferase involved in cell wall biosynthesis